MSVYFILKKSGGNLSSEEPVIQLFLIIML